MTPLRQRYVDDLRLKNFSPGTIKVYVHAVAKFARHFGKSPEQLAAEDIRATMVHLIDRGLKRNSCVVIRNAIRHLYEDTLGRPESMASVPRPKQERRLPVVLSREEVKQMFEQVICPKQKAFLMLAYDTGLRISELIHLRIEDIDSQRMVIRVRQGKGKKDRYARLTPSLLKLLREYWREFRPHTWLFPGASVNKPYDIATPGQFLKKACRRAGSIFSTASRVAGGRFGRGVDGLSEGGEFKAAADAVAEVGVGADAELLRCLHQRRENVHRPGTALAFAVQAHIATTRTHTRT